MLPVAQGRGESPPPNEGGRGEFCCLFQTFSSHGGGCGGGGRGQKRYLSTSLMTRNVLYGSGSGRGRAGARAISKRCGMSGVVVGRATT